MARFARSFALATKSGVPVLQGYGRGDLKVVVNLQVPRHLSAEQREHLVLPHAVLIEIELGLRTTSAEKLGVLLEINLPSGAGGPHGAWRRRWPPTNRDTAWKVGGGSETLMSLTCVNIR